uniref:Uncharacterized protein n=1 Tax=Solanum lycopersicum TaxID=4081 RepID=A0A3Q7GJI2_SOLLC
MTARTNKDESRRTGAENNGLKSWKRLFQIVPAWKDTSHVGFSKFAASHVFEALHCCWNCRAIYGLSPLAREGESWSRVGKEDWLGKKKIWAEGIGLEKG